MRLAAFDVPLDCSGAGRAEERAPSALRAAGLLDRLGARDAGEVAARIRDRRRDPETGVIGADDVRAASAAVAARVGELLGGGERPLAIGGDCTLLLGVFPALPAGSGLWMVDGHADFYDGESSPTGEAADMELSVLTGHGPAGLLADGARRLLEPARTVLLGHRPDDVGPEAAWENARLDPAIEAVTAPQIDERGPAAVGAEAAERLSAHPAWLHVDLDVLDEDVMPAVTYSQPRGLGWEELVALVRPLAAAANLVGVSIADYNPDRDPDAVHARRIVDRLGGLLAG